MRVTGRERGSATVELMALVLVVLIPVAYLFVAFFTAQTGAHAVTDAARSAGRAYVTSGSVAEAEARARAAAAIALADRGRAGPLVTVRCNPACLQPGSAVTITVETRVRLPGAGAILGRSIAAVTVRASHTERVPDYKEWS